MQIILISGVTTEVFRRREIVRNNRVHIQEEDAKGKQVS
jgi:hypothetical protein